MGLAKIPVNIGPKLIGRTVTIQTIPFKYSETESDELNLEEMTKYVGILEAYIIEPSEFGFKLHGCNVVSARYEEEVVEIYEYTGE